jgi:hypothetical protein
MLTARKLRSLELTAGRSPQCGSAYDFPERRAAGRAQSEQAERSYRRLIDHWRQKPTRKSAGAAKARQ